MSDEAGVLLGPGEGEVLPVGAITVTVKATSADTGGALFVNEATIAPESTGPPPHVHEHLTDMFYVLEGTLTVRLGDTEHEVGAGSFMCAGRAGLASRTRSATRRRRRRAS